ncbi:ATP-grasp domain-containing protein [Rudaeicoccus suwonensis]|uniref:D-aspartate ligase n=1 Tax=Rudaeicoccus suwonensis TaxID=657409 RepID=A0A561EBW3_9MICO|nr:ATP-grasp domain-containing protein [Rudaeicoccus suwonensis]TWE13098.1 D-aspartate ligase [Rudaeicoccus suwonensis]
MTYGNDDFVPVILGSGLNAYNIARSLREVFGVRSLAIGRFASRETAHSQIIDVRVVPGLGEADVVIQTLRDVAAEFTGRKLVLFPTIEFYTNVVLRNRAELDQLFLIPLVSTEVADRLMDKTDFYRTCADLGVPHPKTVVVEPDSSIDVDGMPFDYPVIVKPADTDSYPRLSFAGKQKVYLVNDGAELTDLCARIFAAGYTGNLIVQEYLSGDESVMQVANSYSDTTGSARVISAGQVVLTEYNPVLIGNNNAIIPINDDALTSAIRTFLDGVGYVGLANFDVMVDERTGESKLLEVNLRPGATSYYTMAGGLNLIATAVHDLVYDRRDEFTSAQQERLWVNVPYPVVLRYAPPSLRTQLRRAAKLGRIHTLDYGPDLSRQRRLDIARINARHCLDYIKFSKSSLG